MLKKYKRSITMLVAVLYSVIMFAPTVARAQLNAAVDDAITEKTKCFI